MFNIQNYWDKVLEILKQDMNPVMYESYISPIIPVKYTDTHFVVKLKFEGDSLLNVIKSTLNKKYEPNINSAIEQVFGKPLQFIFEDDYIEPTQEIVEVKKTNLIQQENGLITNYLFSNYIVGTSNNMAFAASVAVAENPGEDDIYNPLFLYGGVGLGKTHLMHAIGNHVLAGNPNANVLYVSCEKFTTELIKAIKDRQTYEFKEKYRQVDLLLIDDIQFLKGKEAGQEEFFHTFNELFNANKQIVMTSDRKPSEIQTLTSRLQSRMSKGLIIDIQSPNFETRTAILEKKAEIKNEKISTDVLQYIASNITSNIREMEGVLNKIIVYARLTNKPIDLELAREVMQDIIKDTKSNITISYIQENVADFYKITVDELVSKRRTKPLTTYRHIAMYLCRKLLDNSLEEIGGKFGGRDHSTVMNGCDRVCKLLETDTDRAAEVKNIEKRIVGN